MCEREPPAEMLPFSAVVTVIRVVVFITYTTGLLLGLVDETVVFKKRPVGEVLSVFGLAPVNRVCGRAVSWDELVASDDDNLSASRVFEVTGSRLLLFKELPNFFELTVRVIIKVAVDDRMVEVVVTRVMLTQEHDEAKSAIDEQRIVGATPEVRFERNPSFVYLSFHSFPYLLSVASVPFLGELVGLKDLVVVAVSD